MINKYFIIFGEFSHSHFRLFILKRLKMRINKQGQPLTLLKI
jgi:hypothetical protein